MLRCGLHDIAGVRRLEGGFDRARFCVAFGIGSGRVDDSGDNE